MYVCPLADDALEVRHARGAKQIAAALRDVIEVQEGFDFRHDA
jgi:hypothetical protein